MELNPELIKAVLEWGEKNPPEKEGILLREIEIKGYSSEAIQLHADILCDAGYVSWYVNNPTSRGNASYPPYYTSSSKPVKHLDHLTLNGYQYLNLLRSKAWNAAKSVMHEFGVIFAEAAIKAIIDKVNLPI